MSPRPRRPVLPFAAAIALAVLLGVALGMAAWWAAAAIAATLVAFVAVTTRFVQRAFVAEDAARRELVALVDARTAELHDRETELDGHRRQLEVARTHLDVAERLAAVGRLASGVAHEINNPLAISLTNLSWLRENLPRAVAAEGQPDASREELLAALRDAEEASHRVAEIVRDLQDFAQDRPAAPGGVDLGHVLQHVERLVAPEVRARARLRVELPRDQVWVGGAAAQLAQLCAHLLLHAGRSVGGGGPDVESVRAAVRRDGDGALLEVRHTGPGLQPEALAHVFDPFYEAWASGGGTKGLGLSVCHGLAGALGGHVTAESTPGAGATYRARLPALTSQARLALRRAPGDRLRVLVVDDEPLVVASLYRLLSRSFDVVPQTSARQALALLRAGELFDAVLCDVMMPELSGPAFHEEVARGWPDLARSIVFLTGGAFTPGAREFLERVPNPRLSKPCDTAELVATLARGARRDAPMATA